jgi:hypothetical protein
MAEIYRNIERQIIIDESASMDPTVMRIRLPGGSSRGEKAIQFLIEQSERDAAEKRLESFDFAGQRAGMPNSYVWALSRGAEPIVDHLETVLDRVNQAMTSAQENRHKRVG